MSVMTASLNSATLLSTKSTMEGLLMTVEALEEDAILTEVFGGQRMLSPSNTPRVHHRIFDLPSAATDLPVLPANLPGYPAQRHFPEGSRAQCHTQPSPPGTLPLINQYWGSFRLQPSGVEVTRGHCVRKGLKARRCCYYCNLSSSAACSFSVLAYLLTRADSRCWRTLSIASDAP